MPLIQTEDVVEFGGGRLVSAPGQATVADAMVRRPKLLASTATGQDVRDLFRDDHVHAALVVDGDRLVTVIEDGRCVGLLCLKRSGRGFCCDAGITARALLHQDPSDPDPTRQELTWDE